MTNPSISVIIPCYNSAKYISHAIDAMLCQTLQPVEILIVDDNSTDNLEEVIDPYLKKVDHIQYLRMPFDDPYRINKMGDNVNAGWMARNYGVEQSHGDLITFQDADDGSYSNRIEVQYKIMKEYDVMHVNVDWQKYEDTLNCRSLQYDLDEKDVIRTEEILRIAKRNMRGIFKKPFGKNEDKNPVERLIRKVNRKFVGEYDSYPCAASMPLVKKEVFEKCQFRPVWERTRPSLRGRGADQDFNFWVAETYKKSIAVNIPLVLWRVQQQNNNYFDRRFRPN